MLRLATIALCFAAFAAATAPANALNPQPLPPGPPPCKQCGPSLSAYLKYRLQMRILIAKQLLVKQQFLKQRLALVR